jgi:NAD(P)H dehydrogenase (quinone)
VLAGVNRIVYISFLNAAPDSTFTLARDHYFTEMHIRASGLKFTFLRDSFYLDSIPSRVSSAGIIAGPKAFTFGEAAAELSLASGRPIVYVNETLDEAYASRASYKVEQWEVDGWVSSYLAIAKGELATVSQDIPNVLGRPAMGLKEYLAKHINRA